MVYNSPRRHLIQGISLLEDIIERRRREGQQLNDEEHAALLKLVKAAPLAPHQAKIGLEGTMSNNADSSTTQHSNALIHLAGGAAANSLTTPPVATNNTNNNNNTNNTSVTNVISSNHSLTNAPTSSTNDTNGFHQQHNQSLDESGAVAAVANAGGKISLASRLRKAMGMTSALAMSELLKASRDDISSLVDFAVSCSSLTSSSVKLVQLLVENVQRFVPAGKAVTPMIYNGEFMVDPLSHTMTTFTNKVQKKFAATKNAEVVFDVQEETCYVPIAAEGELFGHLKISNIEDKPEVLPVERQKIIFAAGSIAALALRTSWQLEDLEWSHKKQSTLLKVANSITSNAFVSEVEVISRIAAKAKDLSDSQHAFYFQIAHDEEDEKNFDVKLYHKGELHSFDGNNNNTNNNYHTGSDSNDASATNSSPNSGRHHHNVGRRGSRGANNSHHHRRGGYNSSSSTTAGFEFSGFGNEDSAWNEESHLASLAAEQVAKSTQVLQLQQGDNDEFIEVDGTIHQGGLARSSSMHRAAGAGSSAARAGSPTSGNKNDPMSVSMSRSHGVNNTSTNSGGRGGVRLDVPVSLVKTVSIRNLLALPVLNDEQIVVGVIVLANKNPKKMGRMDVPQIFEQRDAEVMLQLCSLASIALANSFAASRLNDEKRRRDAILSVLSHLNECDIRNVEEICKFVMHGARKLLNADRSTLFLIDEEHDELYSSVADSVGKVIRFPVGRGIAGRVALTGQSEIIRDAYADDRFNKEVDKQTGYRTLSILTLPVITKGNVLAVAQLVNKLDAKGLPIPFSQEDQEILRTFTMFAGMTLSNSKLLEFTVKAGQEAVALTNWENADRGPGLARSGTMTSMSMGANNNAMPPISPSQISEIEQALEKVRALAKAHPEKYDPTTIDFDLFALRDEAEDGATGRDYACAVVVMLFQAAKFDVVYKIDEETLICFVLQCRKQMRHVSYHNFYHVVDATQTIYTFIFSGGGRQLISELESFVLLVTALCHDLDHMGLNNNFHLKSDSPLGILSSVSGNNSVLEVHHCNVAIQILSMSESNVFFGLSKQDSSVAFKAMLSCILATDMAKHMDSLKHFEEIAPDFDKNNEEHRLTAMQMMMKAADISNVTKPFHISRQWAVAVTEEFYQQGDKERARGMQVLPMNDRQLGTELAKGQLGFINFVAQKFFNSMVDNLFEKMSYATDRLSSNKKKWEKIMEDEKSDH